MVASIKMTIEEAKALAFNATQESIVSATALVVSGCWARVRQNMAQRQQI